MPRCVPLQERALLGTRTPNPQSSACQGQETQIEAGSDWDWQTLDEVVCDTMRDLTGPLPSFLHREVGPLWDAMLLGILRLWIKQTTSPWIVC